MINNIVFPQNINTYLGNKGYTVLKSDLSVAQQLAIKKALMVKPFMPGAPVHLQNSFPAYRESDKKFYLPRYFGEEIFGPPKSIKINEGENINLTFNSQLRDYQVPVAEKYLEHVKDGGSALLELYCAFGKTALGIYFMCCLKKKTLVIVHKEFLMNQWIQRLNDFAPGARIGKIQGQVIDIDDKDIVICMLQSLSMKDYPSTLFDSFGFTIVDEVHHISSEVFSQALFKMVTKYMLGLSATMDRPDGTTKVFKMFLGPVVVKAVREGVENVTVRAITFQTNDEEFNNLELDFRGKTAASKMLGKISTYNRRTQFIVSVIKDMILENNKQQIMIIASYKNILAYIYDAIKHNNICSVGYYVGGMKESELKESEKKQCVLATYSMAAEGLDIKTLSTIVMTTPMTRIEQATGRILREKHDFGATIVDIIDTHDNFQRQWLKRKAFYKKQNYKIIHTNSLNYTPDVGKWKTTFEPIKKGETNCVDDDEDDDEDDSDNSDTNNTNSKNPIGVCLLKMKNKK